MSIRKKNLLSFATRAICSDLHFLVLQTPKLPYMWIQGVMVQQTDKRNQTLLYQSWPDLNLHQHEMLLITGIILLWLLKIHSNQLTCIA